MKWLLIGLVVLTRTGIGLSQNLIKNGGFEEWDKTCHQSITTRYHFTKYVRYWKSPTRSNPIIYSDDIDSLCNHFYLPYYLELGPYEGHNVVSIQLGNPFNNSRSYLQINTEPLVTGEEYYFEIWITHRPTSDYITNNLGLFLTDSCHFDNKDKLISRAPIFNYDSLIETKGEWMKISGTFRADRNYCTAIIGNFKSEGETVFKKISSKGLNNAAFYFIDAVYLGPIDSAPLE